MDSMDSVTILGVSVESRTAVEALSAVGKRISDGLPTKIAFLNAHLSFLAAVTPDINSALQDFTILNDGIGIDVARRVLHGSSFPANLNGTDFVPALLSGIEKPLRLFLLGAHPETLAKTAAAIARNWPRHVIAGQANGYFSEQESASLRETIAACEPDLVLVAMGNPRQELWIAQNIPTCCPCAIGVGGWFEFVADVAPRAPFWMRRVRAEWLFRLCREPRRLWYRYTVESGAFMWLILRARAQERLMLLKSASAVLVRSAKS